MSSGFSNALRRLGVKCLVDLDGVTERDVWLVSNGASELIIELCNLITLAREGSLSRESPSVAKRGFTAPTARQRKTNSACDTDKPSMIRSPTPARVLPHEEPVELIFIPQEAHGQRAVGFRLSAHLAHIFEWEGLILLGQLHGMSYAEFLKFRNFGRKTTSWPPCPLATGKFYCSGWVGMPNGLGRWRRSALSSASHGSASGRLRIRQYPSAPLCNALLPIGWREGDTLNPCIVSADTSASCRVVGGEQCKSVAGLVERRDSIGVEWFAGVGAEGKIELKLNAARG